MSGHSGLYPGSNFVAVGDVILVTINYRLSALGFLTTGDNRIKGTPSKNINFTELASLMKGRL